MVGTYLAPGALILAKGFCVLNRLSFSYSPCLCSQSVSIVLARIAVDAVDTHRVLKKLSIESIDT